MTHLRAIIAAGVLAACAGHALARPDEPAETGSERTPAERALDRNLAVESYMERLGLRRLLAEHLEMQLAKTPKEQRVGPAERLGKLYVELISASTGVQNAPERRVWEDKARTLLNQVPEADSFDLRLSLGRAVYQQAEEIAERQRLRLATPEETAEAELSFRALASQFNEIAVKAHRRVDQLERIEQQGDASDKLVTELADARRQRSLAFYYEGWARTYLAQLTRGEQPAIEAMRAFGWLLNSSGGKQATLDRLPPAMLQYEHIARAAIACGLCAAQRGSDVEALRWLDFVQDAEQTPAAVREQLPARRVVILAQAKRWADLELLIRRTRKSDRAGGGPELTPLPPLLARLLAVSTLEADRRTAGPQIEALARIAMQDLVTQKEVSHVLDLVRKYGTTPLGNTGFIVNYVRALQAYDEARSAHENSGGSTDEPTTVPGTANLYHAAANLFQSAARESDAESFPMERARAGVMQGRSLFFAGDLMAAAEAFLAAHTAAGKSPAGEEPLYLGVLALERAAKLDTAANSGIRERLNQMIAVFLQTYPDSEQAPRLTLMQISMGSLGDDDALKVLMNVPRESPVYEAARRQVARILYTKFRTARGPERDFAARRFIGVGEEVLAADRKVAMEGSAAEARTATERVVVRARQLLDALLGTSAPDVSRAEAVLKLLSGVASYNNHDLFAHRAELAFRELQIAMAKGDDDQIDVAATMLFDTADASAQFHSAGERTLYRHYQQKLKPGEPADADLAARIIKYGRRVVDRIGSDPAQLRDPAIAALYSGVSEAAAQRAITMGDTSMRDLSIRLDRALLSVQPRAEPVLRRLAGTSEASMDLPLALSCWSTMLAAAAPGTDAFFEARYHTIRITLAIDPAKAKAAFDEHIVLYPAGGPEPWGAKIMALGEQLRSAAPAVPANTVPSTPAPIPAPTP